MRMWTVFPINFVLQTDLVHKIISHSMSSYLRDQCNTVIHSHCRENDATERVDDKPINLLGKERLHRVA